MLNYQRVSGFRPPFHWGIGDDGISRKMSYTTALYRMNLSSWMDLSEKIEVSAGQQFGMWYSL